MNLALKIQLHVMIGDNALANVMWKGKNVIIVAQDILVFLQLVLLNVMVRIQNYNFF